jgi:hypothetical protein
VAAAERQGEGPLAWDGSEAHTHRGCAGCAVPQGPGEARGRREHTHRPSRRHASTLALACVIELVVRRNVLSSAMESRGAPAGGPAAARPPGVVCAGEGCESIPARSGAALQVGGEGFRSTSEQVGERPVLSKRHFGPSSPFCLFTPSRHHGMQEPSPSSRVPQGAACAGVVWHSGGGAATPSGQKPPFHHRVCGERLQRNARAGAAAKNGNPTCSWPLLCARHGSSGDAPRCSKNPGGRKRQLQQRRAGGRGGRHSGRDHRV